MSDDVQAFHEAILAIQKRGRTSPVGRLPDGFFPENQFAGMFGSFKQRFDARWTQSRARIRALKPLPVIIFDYAFDTTLNAHTFRHEGRYFVAVNSGTMVILHDLFLRLLSVPHVFPAIGDASKETLGNRRLPFSLDVTQLIDHYGNANSTLDQSKPKDETRLKAAHMMTRMAFDFLTTHEVRHILAGHVDYNGAFRGFPLIDELDLQSLDPASGMKSQAMEMDADGSGIFTVLANAVDELNSSDPSRSAWRSILQNPHQAIVICLVCIDAVFKLFSTAGDVRWPWDMRTHPPHHVRRTMAIGVMEAYFRGNGLSEWLDELNSPGVTDELLAISEFTFRDVFGHPIDRVAWSRAAGLEYEEHVGLLRETWNLMHHELSQFSYINLQKAL